MIRGFTLIELIVTLAIVSVLLGLGIPAFRNFGAEQELQLAAEEIVATLQEAQALSLAPRGGELSYTVGFSTTSPREYNLWAKKNNSSQSSVTLKQSKTPPTVTVSNFTPRESSTDTRWEFKVNDQGRLASGVNQSITLSHRRGVTKTITGNHASGLIEILNNR